MLRVASRALRQLARFAASPTAPQTRETSRAAEPHKPVFSELGLNHDLQSAVQELGLGSPSEIQAAAIPKILHGDHTVIASHTGSGKTLAYLLPLVQRLREMEREPGYAPRVSRPRAIILVPTRELAEQVTAVSKRLCHSARLRVGMISGGMTEQRERRLCQSQLDILISTPKRLVELLHLDPFSLLLHQATSIHNLPPSSFFETSHSYSLMKLIHLLHLYIQTQPSLNGAGLSLWKCESSS